MNPFQILKQDHKKVTALLDEILETSERSTKNREQLFTEVKDSLDRHAKTEEDLLYPLLKEIKESHLQTTESYEEHSLMKIVLKELSSLATNHEDWLGKLKTLKDVVEHHVEEEEKTLFPMAEKLLSKDQLAEIQSQIAQYQDQFEKEEKTV